MSHYRYRQAIVPDTRTVLSVVTLIVMLVCLILIGVAAVFNKGPVVETPRHTATPIQVHGAQFALQCDYTLKLGRWGTPEQYFPMTDEQYAQWCAQ